MASPNNFGFIKYFFVGFYLYDVFLFPSYVPRKTVYTFLSFVLFSFNFLQYIPPPAFFQSSLFLSRIRPPPLLLGSVFFFLLAVVQLRRKRPSFFAFLLRERRQSPSLSSICASYYIMHSISLFSLSLSFVILLKTPKFVFVDLKIFETLSRLFKKEKKLSCELERTFQSAGVISFIIFILVLKIQSCKFLFSHFGFFVFLCLGRTVKELIRF